MPAFRALLALALAATAVAACAPAGMSPAGAPGVALPAGLVVDAGQGPAGLVVRPVIAPPPGRQLLAAVQPNTAATIVHLIVKVYEGTAPETYVTEADVPSVAFGSPITFVGLRNNRTYRVRAHAYASAGVDDQISIDASSYTDIVVGMNDTPAVANLPVLLVDVPFSGLATSAGLAITPGGHMTTGAEMLMIGVPLTDTCFVGTWAGMGDPGYDDGPSGSVTFDDPMDVACVGKALFVVDRNNHAIRRITDGEVTTFAGDGTAGTDDGTGTGARFDTPVAVCADAAGNLYILEHGSGAPQLQRVRKITPQGVVTTLAGGPRGGSVPTCTGAAAAFADPGGLAVDPAGTFLYVADTQNQVIRRIDLLDAGLQTTTIAGQQNVPAHVDNALGTAAAFFEPAGVAVDLAGDVIVADTANAAVRKVAVTSAGNPVTTVAGTLAAPQGQVDGDASGARFRSVADVAVDAQGNILVLDNSDVISYPTESNSLRKLTYGAGGVLAVTTLAGSGFGHAEGMGTGAGSDASWGIARGLGLAVGGDLYFAATADQRVRRATMEQLQ